MNESTGVLQRALAHLFGTRATRLSERLAHAHWLSYLLIVAQSAAVVLVLGHAELPLLFNASWAIKALAGMGVFVLLASVLASDMALLASLRRIPVLARNRQRTQLREHVLFVGFVLLVEASTYAVVMAALDSNPRALVSGAPLIPNQGPVFVAQVILRAILVCWAAVQLVIVRGKLPVLLSTLTATGKEIVGGHVEKRLAGLDIAGISLPAAFKVYAAMSKPPRRVRTWANGWLVNRELAAEQEEERQVQNVVNALEDLERRQHIAAAATPDEAPQKPPTGPGTPTATPALRRARDTEPTGTVVELRKRDRAATPRQATHARLTKRQRQRAKRVDEIVAMLRVEPNLSAYKIARRLKPQISESYARKLRDEALELLTIHLEPEQVAQ